MAVHIKPEDVSFSAISECDMEVIIEVAVPESFSTTDRGEVLEKFGKKLLETLNHKVIERVRITGIEVDLLATENYTQERILVECKAHRDNVSADVISKLVGNVSLKNYSAGWLISTGKLTKDAVGLKDEWDQRPPEVRRKLKIFDPDALIQLLWDTNKILRPESFSRPSIFRYAEEWYFLITPWKEYWVSPILDASTGMRQAVILFDAITGEAVNDSETLTLISSTDTTLAGHKWIANENHEFGKKEGAQLKRELQSIVKVPKAENWADYRPARPEDFVGREDTLSKMFDFFCSVRDGETATRLFAVKAPSGWGKSSFILKLIAKAENKRNKNSTFVYATDCRAATSKRFAELALYTLIKEAIDSSFIEAVPDFTFGNTDSPFSTPAMQSILSQLKAEGKVLCLVFDQFEELLYKAELEEVFDEVQTLCHAVDSAETNIVIGFSWKTDGTIPADHKAYHLWHSLADRRWECELDTLNAKEVSSALNKFEKELGQKISPQLRRVLQDQCQGFPWLLKKLCIHVLDLVKNGRDQSEVLTHSLNISDLFDSDMQKLDASEAACIKQIATEAPAEFFKIAELYGDDVVNRLLDKRLVIRTGPSLSIYWDIFRDYILTGKVPEIPTKYIPVSQFSSYMRAALCLLKHGMMTYDELATELKVSKDTADNIVRDLVMVGHADADRKLETIKSIAVKETELIEILLNFCKSHVVYKDFISVVAIDTGFTESASKGIIKKILKDSGLSEAVIETYRKKLFKWFQSVGLLDRDAGKCFFRMPPQVLLSIDGTLTSYNPRGKNVFSGQAPPERVLEGLRLIDRPEMTASDLEKVIGRNSLSVLVSLGFLDKGHFSVSAAEISTGLEKMLRQKVDQNETISFVKSYIMDHPKSSGDQIGEAVARQFDCDWSKASNQRYGNGIRKWALWSAGMPNIYPSRTKKDAHPTLFDV